MAEASWSKDSLQNTTQKSAVDSVPEADSQAAVEDPSVASHPTVAGSAGLPGCILASMQQYDYGFMAYK